MISAYWLIPAFVVGVNFGLIVMALFAAGAQANARLDRSEDDPRAQQSHGAVSVSHVGAALQQTKERNLG